MDEAFIIMQIGTPGLDAVCNAGTPRCFWQSGRAYRAIALATDRAVCRTKSCCDGRETDRFGSM